MNKILVIGDLHCRRNNTEIVESLLDQCLDIVKERGIKEIIFLGDVNDTKAVIRSEVVKMLLDKLPNFTIPMHIIVGNHDYNNPIECEGHSLEFLRNLSNVTIYDSPKIYKNFLMMPYRPEDKFVTELEELRNTLPEGTDLSSYFLVCHQDTAKARFSAGRQSESSLTSDIYSPFKLVLAGHIHMAQEFDNIVYVGTPYTSCFAEADEIKSVVVLDTDTCEYERITLDLPRHVVFDYTAFEMKDMKKIAKDLASHVSPDMIVKVVIRAKNSIIPKIQKSLFPDIDIKTLKTIPLEEVKDDSFKLESLSNKDIMEQFLNTRGFDESQLERLLVQNSRLFEKYSN